MMKKLFPYELQLHIFQLDEYNAGKFFSWVRNHFFKRSLENKKPLVWTPKAKAIYYLSLLLAFLVTMLLTYSFDFSGFILGLLLSTQAYAYLIIAYYLLLPLESYRKKRIKSLTETKLNNLPNLKVIGITGSYGKTSMKDFLYQMLRTEYKVLKTPESYNTPYGIAKVVHLELDPSYEYFICEMGAYRRGDIKEICDMVHPKYGILTAINEQHLNTFGSLENTTKGKFELIDALPADGIGVVNIDNQRIQRHYNSYTKTIIPYGFTDNNFSIQNIKQTPQGTEFSLVLDGTSHNAKTKLLGKPNIQNILGAATMSYQLGMTPHAITAAIAMIKPVPHRLEIKELKTLTLIDNAYNSNVDGFRDSIDLLSTFKRPTVFVTPGIVDLGEKTFALHKELGELLHQIDHVILVGDSERTKGLKEGMKKKDHIIEVTSINEIWDLIKEMKLDHPVVLLENDLPDNY